MNDADRACRVALLRGLPGFAGLPTATFDALAERLEASRQPAGAVLVREGEVGDRLYLIAAGQAEAASQTPGGAVPLAALGPGECFGEIALLALDRRRRATVTAQSDIELLALPRAAFDDVLSADAGARATWEAAAEEMLRAKFLKEASPFAHLSPAEARALAARLATREVAAGTVIFRAGEAGDTCHLVRRGEVAVLLDDGEVGERELCRLGPGALFGEMALLSDAARSATVRATEDSELLTLRRADLLAAMALDRAVGLRIVELFRFRDRPRRLPAIEAFERRATDGQPVIVLKNRDRHTYYRLSPDGWFLWQLLDGSRSLRDLILEYFRTYKRFAPGIVVGLLEGLAGAGMLKVQALSVEAMAGLGHVPRWQRLLAAATRLLSWQASATGCDAWFDRAYRSGAWLLFTPAVLALMTLLALSGLGAFVYALADDRVSLAPSAAGDWLLVFVIVANLVAILLHEAGHAFATKHYRREIDRIGIGWYWLGPIAFVDTSDMWLMDRGPRIAVNLAGVSANAVCAGIAALMALSIADGAWAAVLWQFVLVSYALVLFNLNPLLEYDGYYVLIDWLDRPNLRRQALVWLTSGLPAAWRRPAELRQHWLELSFVFSALVYLVVACILTAVLLASFLDPWLAPLLATTLAWTPTVLLAVMATGEIVVAARAGQAGKATV